MSTHVPCGESFEKHTKMLSLLHVGLTAETSRCEILESCHVKHVQR